MTAYKEPQLSFGGVKPSGAGIPKAGHTGIEFFSEHKVAYVKYAEVQRATGRVAAACVFVTMESFCRGCAHSMQRFGR